MDALTDVLKTVHLTGSLHFRSELSAPWGMAVPASDSAQFHVVRRGRCWLMRDGDNTHAPLLLEAGDLVLLPQGSAHALVDDPRTPPVALSELVERYAPQDGAGPMVLGGGGDAVTLVCGYFQFAAGDVHPLLSMLPPLIILRG